MQKNHSQKYVWILISKRWKSLIPENDYEFLVISQYLQISCAVDSSGIGYVLTEILQIDQKITFDIFHTLNQGHISKIKKIPDCIDLPKKDY